MSRIDPDKNCHEYCRFARQCKYCKGSNGYDPEECGWAYKIEDLMNDAEDIRREQIRSIAEEFGVDESEVDDWC